MLNKIILSIPGCTHKKHTHTHKKKEKKKKNSLVVKQLNRKLEPLHVTNSKTAPLTSSSSSVPGWFITESSLVYVLDHPTAI